ncbi:Globulin-1 S allele [Citrus sinensis]|uniref:Cupin type-1 domain-containing protein n=1 Tax=Citrus sinensis TaxID=2711 RepID=A0A067FZ38_CITSI|nr:Globulin-1 S allele [Citrus sinensis]KDO68672.1 hypothetical protein CISIN_1g040805mg [Citrus sinensis]
MNRKLCFTLFTLSVLVLCAGLALATKDPELKQCKHQCRARQQYDEKQKEQCARTCEEYYKEKEQRERHREGESEEEKEWGGRHEWMNPGEPAEKHLRQCQRECDRQEEGGQQRALCRFRCQEKYRREKEGEGGQHNTQEEEEEEEGDEESSRVTSQHGRVAFLPKFTQRSKLLRGLEKYRLGILIANPQTFVTPTHLDADAVFFVSWGQGTITVIRENNRESYNVKRGDIIRVPSGNTFYVTNTDDDEKLYIVKFIKSINLPGQYEAFYGAGGENPESFLRAFSWEILESAFKTKRDSLERVLFQQDQGAMVKASKQQIRALSRSQEGPSIWPFAGESRGTFNLFGKRPSHSNNFGELFEADSNDFRPLEDLDITVSYANISKGAMAAPFYNSRSTKVAVVVAGDGYIEIACPHVSRSSSERRHQGSSTREEGSATYHKVSSRIRTDSAYIVPAGHPVVTVASQNNNLEVVCFEINAEGNIRFPLAGRNKIFKVMESEAKELAFNTRADEVERVFGNQDQDWFFKGPSRWHQQQQGRAYE